jgi:AraC-like DNA-binding protein
VLSGDYEEAGDQGRFRLEPGDVVFHSEFEGHLDRFPAAGAVVLNLPIRESIIQMPPLAEVSDPGLILRAAKQDPGDALELLLSTAIARTSPAEDWPDVLAATLLANPSTKLALWAQQHSLASWSVSRGFTQVFGVSPEAFRARARTRRALRLLQHTRRPMAYISAELGFSDQAHMARSVALLTGVSPKAWRTRANGFKTRR